MTGVFHRQEFPAKRYRSETSLISPLALRKNHFFHSFPRFGPGRARGGTSILSLRELCRYVAAQSLDGEGEPCTTWGAGQCPEPHMVQGLGVEERESIGGKG
jgi:hypothetical protein